MEKINSNIQFGPVWDDEFEVVSIGRLFENKNEVCVLTEQNVFDF